MPNRDAEDDELAEEDSSVTQRLSAELAEVRKRMDERARSSGKVPVSRERRTPLATPAATPSGTRPAPQDDDEPPATTRVISEDLRKTRS